MIGKGGLLLSSDIHQYLDKDSKFNHMLDPFNVLILHKILFEMICCKKF